MNKPIPLSRLKAVLNKRRTALQVELLDAEKALMQSAKKARTAKLKFLSQRAKLDEIERCEAAIADSPAEPASADAPVVSDNRIERIRAILFPSPAPGMQLEISKEHWAELEKLTTPAPATPEAGAAG